MGDGADKRAQAVRGERRRGGRGGGSCQLARVDQGSGGGCRVGPERMAGVWGKGGASGPAGELLGQQAELRMGGEREMNILFKSNFQNYFQMSFESF